MASTVQLTDHAEAITEGINCNSGENHLRDCLPDVLDGIRSRSDVAGLTCSTFTVFQIVVVQVCSIDCTDGVIRLVDGSSYDEGRVEVCSNGRWGTVCGNGWTEREAGLVCSRLGFPTLSKARVLLYLVMLYLFTLSS